MRPNISGIVFDIGGVLVTLDGTASLAALLGIEASYWAIHELWMSCPSVVAHETGRISAEEFSTRVVADLNLPISAELFLRDFSTWPGALQPGALELIKDIPSTYRTAVLSNTSAVHWEKIGTLGLAECFTLVYLSHKIGRLKPSPEAFHVALQGMELLPEEVVFFDDNRTNIDAAKSLGINAYRVRNPAEAREVLVRLEVLKPANTQFFCRIPLRPSTLRMRTPIARRIDAGAGRGELVQFESPAVRATGASGSRPTEEPTGRRPRRVRRRLRRRRGPPERCCS
jgi:putative hydrolase of the HAD superfamily